MTIATHQLERIGERPRKGRLPEVDEPAGFSDEWRDQRGGGSQHPQDNITARRKPPRSPCRYRIALSAAGVKPCAADFCKRLHPIHRRGRGTTRTEAPPPRPSAPGATAPTPTEGSDRASNPGQASLPRRVGAAPSGTRAEAKRVSRGNFFFEPDSGGPCSDAARLIPTGSTDLRRNWAAIADEHRLTSRSQPVSPASCGEDGRVEFDVDPAAPRNEMCECLGF